MYLAAGGLLNVDSYTMCMCSVPLDVTRLVRPPSASDERINHVRLVVEVLRSRFLVFDHLAPGESYGGGEEEVSEGYTTKSVESWEHPF